MKILFILIVALLNIGSVIKAQDDSNILLDANTTINAALFDDRNNNLILATSNKVQLWDILTGEKIKEFLDSKDDVFVLALSLDGNLIACGGRDDYIYIWDIQDFKLINKIKTNDRFTTALAFNIDGTEIVSGSYDNKIKRWDVKSTRLISSFDVNCPVAKIKYDKINDTFLCGLFNGEILTLDPTITNTIKKLRTGSYLSTFEISEKGSLLVAAGCEDGTSSYACSNSFLKVWELNSLQLVSSKTFGSKPIKSMLILDTNQELLAIDDTLTIKKFNISPKSNIDISEIKIDKYNNILALLKITTESDLIGITKDGLVFYINLDNQSLVYSNNDDMIKSNSQALIKRIVEQKINEWQKKGKFEKTEDYQKRVNIETRELKIQEFVAETINEIASKKVKIDFSSAKNEYDADNEVFKIVFKNLSPLFLKVPISEAQKFDEDFHSLVPRDAQFIFKDDNKFALVNLKIVNPKDGKEYVYESKNELSFFTSNLQLNFDDINIGIVPQNVSNNVQESTKKINVGKSEVDVNLPLSKNNNPNAIAVVIGNRDYQKTSKVDYAINDAQSVKDYLIQVLGFKDGNIIYEANASKGIFEIIFGSKENTKGKLNNYIQPGVSDVFIYYSGHGAPDLKNKKGYFVPIEADPNYVDISGYSLDLFYSNISQLKAKSLTVVLDACFSGANVYENISPITITMDAPELVDPRIVVMSSSSGSEVSSWYQEKGHGLFTYYFLKAIHSKNADTNSDNKITVGEIYNYTIKANDGVNYQARRKGLEQNPTLIGNDINRVLVEW